MNFPRDLFGVFAGRRDSVKRRRTGRQGRGGQSAASGRSRRRQAPLSHEAMEARLALAVYGFSQAEYQQLLSPNGLDELGEPVQRDGWAMVVGEANDDIYIQQVATSPQTLLYADNGSFIDLPGVEGDFGQISDINALRSLSVTNAAVINDLGVVNDNYPVFDFTNSQNSFVTRFVSQHDDWGALESATLQYRQADGTLQQWTIDPNLNIAAQPGTVRRPFDVWPSSRGSLYEPAGAAAFVQISLDVTWEVQALPAQPRQAGAPLVSPFTSVPQLINLTYTHADELVQQGTRVIESLVLPSAAAPIVAGTT